MIAVVPAFFPEDDRFWPSDEGLRLLGLALDNLLAAAGLDRVVLATNAAWAEQLARPRLDIRLCPPWPAPEAGAPRALAALLPPPGALAALDIPAASDVMLVDFANPLLSSRIIGQAIGQAIARFASGDSSVLLSVVQSLDHPCQLKALFKSKPSSVRLAAFLDPDFVLPQLPPGRYRATRPFLLPSRFLDGPASPAGLYTRTLRYSERRDVLTALSEPDSFEERQTLWLTSDGLFARLLVAAELLDGLPPDAAAVAVAPFAPAGPEMACIVKKEAGKDLFLLPGRLFGPGLSGRTRYRLAALRSGRILESLEIEDPGELDPVRLPGLPDDCDGLACQRVEVASDFCVYGDNFPHDPQQWRFDENGRPVRCDTGEIIQGRQQFPEVYEPDGSFLIARQEALSGLDGILAESRAGYCVVPRTRSVHINGAFDRLKYLAKLRALKNNESVLLT
ncbi:MAG: hypothetical protein HQK82_08650 [Desulfovibrionaceae bacterium]|nr:hypothetical protein [Desulfovibrionaceae bacterium]